MSKGYGAKQIKVLEGLEAVRKRPGMYIGSTSSKGLHHLVYEVVDNSIDEAMGGHCDAIGVTIHKDNSITVVDNGRGIPVEMHEVGKPAVEVVLTVLHAGGKFNDEGYKMSGGLHGVGVSVVNALSSHMKVDVRRGGKIHSIEFKKGITSSKLKVIGSDKKTGTTIWFKPDDSIFDETVYDFGVLKQRFKELAYLNKGIKIALADQRSGKNEVFHYSGGIASFIDEMNKGKEVVGKTIYFEGEINRSFEGKQRPVNVEISFQYGMSDKENVISFVNNINTYEGGEHLTGFKTALTKTINEYARLYRSLKDKDENLLGDDVLEGLTAIVSVKMYSPIFEGQTKTKLANKEVRGIVSSIVSDELSEIFDGNKSLTKKVIDRIMLARSAREAAKKARELVKRKSELDNSFGFLPGKLADCSTHDIDVSEIYIVEGDSAGGSAKQGRDRKFQAILPLRGKILNVEKSNLKAMLDNNEITSMLQAFGCGIGRDIDLDNLRYGKIIIMTDADVDGAHIRTLLLTFFYRYMKPLIMDGRIFIAQPPLFKVTKGKRFWYSYSEEEMRVMTNVLGDGCSIQRYKGLGEMNPEQLWATTMNPETRTLLVVRPEDEMHTNEIFSVLMGDDVSYRRAFIEENACYATNIDT